VIVVVAERCDGCGVCVDACPAGAITVVDGLARVDSTKCRLCEACLDVCPRDALVMTESALTASPPSPLALPRETAVEPVVRRSSWLAKAAPLAASVVGFVGREILPLVIDRLTAPTAAAGTNRSLPSVRQNPSARTVVQRRHRHRGGRA